jgi:hypothetical protein
MMSAPASVAPVEYAVAVDRYLAEAGLGPASGRVYRISLAGWAWSLVGKIPPAGRSRRLASPPIVPLAVLDDSDTGSRLAAAVAVRLHYAEARTVNRELSALRSAVGWWQRQRWITADPTAGLHRVGDRSAALRPLTGDQLAALFSSPATLREQAFWHLLADSGAGADAVLALDADAVTDRGQRGGIDRTINWTPATGQLLSWLVAGRRHGPLFLTDRRAPAGTSRADVCPLSGRGRMSYRRAAEIFGSHTRRLDPDGRGWVLHQLRGGSR